MLIKSLSKKLVEYRKKKLNVEEKNRRRKIVLYGERVSSKLLKEMHEIAVGNLVLDNQD